MQDHEITVAFQEAAETLHFQFEPTLKVAVGEGLIVHTLGRVPDFGAINGALIFDEATLPSGEVLELLKAHGYFCSQLFASYAHFDVDHFKGTLNDWQYFGPAAQRPAWYTGTPWSS